MEIWYKYLSLYYLVVKEINADTIKLIQEEIEKNRLFLIFGLKITSIFIFYIENK